MDSKSNRFTHVSAVTNHFLKEENTNGSSAFKFLPNIGKYIVGCFEKKLSQDLLDKWRFPTEYKNRQQDDIFRGDGSRGGPERRELTFTERDSYTTALGASSARLNKL